MPETTSVIVVGAHGRMGQEICRLAKQEGAFNLAAAIDLPDAMASLAKLGSPVSANLADVLAVDAGAVIIDFTAPANAVKSARAAAEARAPIVIGTTGLDSGQLGQLEQCAKRTPCLWSANMSVGVNVLLEALPRIAEALGAAYDIEIAEIHHKKKKDSPSGTALMLGAALAKSRGWDLDEARISCREGIIGERPQAQIGIQALRGGDVAGIHTVYFLGPGEIIEIRHQAESRENFAQGALRAAAWLKGRPAGRLYSMRDVLGFVDNTGGGK